MKNGRIDEKKQLNFHFHIRKKTPCLLMHGKRPSLCIGTLLIMSMTFHVCYCVLNMNYQALGLSPGVSVIYGKPTHDL